MKKPSESISNEFGIFRQALRITRHIHFESITFFSCQCFFLYKLVFPLIPSAYIPLSCFQLCVQTVMTLKND